MSGTVDERNAIPGNETSTSYDCEVRLLVDGEKVEWKKGDLILLPIKPGGVEHQHFNRTQDRPARWLALIYGPFQDSLAHFLEQKEELPHGVAPR